MFLFMTQVPEQETAEAPARWLTASQVADELEVAPETVSAWAREGKIAHITLPSGQRRFAREVVDGILAGNAA